MVKKLTLRYLIECLESYYKGIRSSQLSKKDTTKYQWGFAKKIGKADQDKVDSIRDSIDTMTNVRFAQEVNRLTGKSIATESNSTIGPGAPRKVLGPSMPPPFNSQGSSRRPMTADEGNRVFHWSWKIRAMSIAVANKTP